MKMKTMRSLSDKTWLHMMSSSKKKEDSKNIKNSRFLITVNVFGSAGPLRFVVNDDENASGVIKTTLKLYALEGRLPLLGSDTTRFVLYRVNAEFDALKACEAVGSNGERNFVLCKNEMSNPSMTTQDRSESMDAKKGRRWRFWLPIANSFHLKILPR